MKSKKSMTKTRGGRESQAIMYDRGLDREGETDRPR